MSVFELNFFSFFFLQLKLTEHPVVTSVYETAAALDVIYVSQKHQHDVYPTSTSPGRERRYAYSPKRHTHTHGILEEEVLLLFWSQCSLGSG